MPEAAVNGKARDSRWCSPCWTPPIPVLRRLGVRTAAEIDEERHALKAIRGDFDGLADRNPQTDNTRAIDALEAVRC